MGRKPTVVGNVAAAQLCEELLVDRDEYYAWVSKGLLNKAASAGLNEMGAIELGSFAFLKKEFGLEAARDIWSGIRGGLKAALLSSGVRLIVVGRCKATLSVGAGSFFEAIPLRLPIRVYDLDEVVSRSREAFKNVRPRGAVSVSPHRKSKPIALASRPRTK